MLARLNRATYQIKEKLQNVTRESEKLKVKTIVKELRKNYWNN